MPRPAVEHACIALICAYIGPDSFVDALHTDLAKVVKFVQRLDTGKVKGDLGRVRAQAGETGGDVGGKLSGPKCFGRNSRSTRYLEPALNALQRWNVDIDICHSFLPRSVH